MRRELQLTLALVALLALQTVNGTPCGTSRKFVSISHSTLQSQIDQVFILFVDNTAAVSSALAEGFAQCQF